MGTKTMEPGGIVVLEPIPPAPAPQLRAFVWCRHHGNEPTLKGDSQPAPLPGALMVGRFSVGSVTPEDGKGIRRLRPSGR